MTTAAAERVAQALEQAKVATGRTCKVTQALELLEDTDEREAWLVALRDPSIHDAWLHRAMRTAGLDVGETTSSIKTWRSKRGIG